MKKTISPIHAIELAGSQAALARVFKPALTRQAVGRWLDAGAIPQARLWQLLSLKPKWFR